jgi:hypothetical protein
MSVARPMSNGTKTNECAMRLTGTSHLKNDPLLRQILVPVSYVLFYDANLAAGQRD